MMFSLLLNIVAVIASEACCEPSKKCANEGISKCVGKFDPFCLMEWDEQCVSEAQSACGLNCASCAPPPDKKICSELKPKYIRKNFRAMDDNERTAFLDAIYVMKTTTMATGQELYGEGYMPYSYFVEAHWSAAHTLPCDSAHFWAGFAAWHRAFELKFEVTLRLIDPNIKALPYWDLAQDLDMLGNDGLSKSSLFTSAWLGSMKGNPDNHYIVEDMYWGTFPIEKCDDVPVCVESHKNAYGFQRNNGNPNPAPHATRMNEMYGTSMKDYANWGKVNETALLELDTFSEVDKFVNALDGPHNAGHQFVGGAWAQNQTTGAHIPAVVGGPTPLGDLHFFQSIALYTLAVSGTDLNPSKCMSPKNSCPDQASFPEVTPDQCTWASAPGPGSAGCMPLSAERGITNPFHEMGLSYGYQGEMSSGSGPNDPLFFFVHANTDRLYFEWAAAQYDKGNYPLNSDFGFTEAALDEVCYQQTTGSNAFDPSAKLGELDGTTNIDELYIQDYSNLFKNVAEDQQPTYSEALNMANVDYAYDTVCTTTY